MRVTAGIVGACLLILGTLSANAQYTVKSVKVCSAVIPGNWRNDLPVPRAWTKAMCNAWAVNQIRATGQNYGCLSATGMKYDGDPNWNTCGW
jgi:hypothetical protein